MHSLNRLKQHVCNFRSEQLEGNAQYEGFCIDIIIELANLYHFKYEFINVPNEVYGDPYDEYEGGYKHWRYLVCIICIQYLANNVFAFPFYCSGMIGMVKNGVCDFQLSINNKFIWILIYFCLR